MSTIAIDHKGVVYLTAALVLPQLVADADDEPDEIADIVRTAVEFGLELVDQVESQFAVEADEAEKQAG